MGFPVGYREEVLLPKVFLQLLSVLSFVRNLITLLLCYLGLQDYSFPQFESVSALLIGEILPVVKLSELGVAEEEKCAVCLYELEAEDQIRRLTNCHHIFHRECLDRWMEYGHRTCPLCRTSFIPCHMQAAFNHTLWAASGIPEFYHHHLH